MCVCARCVRRLSAHIMCGSLNFEPNARRIAKRTTVYIFGFVCLSRVRKSATHFAWMVRRCLPNAHTNDMCVAILNSHHFDLILDVDILWVSISFALVFVHFIFLARPPFRTLCKREFVPTASCAIRMIPTPLGTAASPPAELTTKER